MIDEYENEKIKGLPQDLPPGETLLWQGSPDWQSLARHMTHASKAAIYFAILAAWSVVSTYSDGGSAADTAQSLARVGMIGGVGLGLLCLWAWATAKTTIYSITSRRAVMRMGIVVPMTMNVPFKSVGAANVRHYKDGTGDLTLGINGGQRIAYFQLWPHARPWRFASPEPALRSLTDVDAVAKLLSDALSAYAAANPVPVTASPAMTPSKGQTAPERPERSGSLTPLPA